jgi:hypothetical protein
MSRAYSLHHDASKISPSNCLFEYLFPHSPSHLTNVKTKKNTHFLFNVHGV